MGIITLFVLWVLLASIFCKPRGIKRIATTHDNQGKLIYIIEIYGGVLGEEIRGGDHAGDWCLCGWSRIDPHDYYTREEAEYSLKYGEPGRRQ